MKSFIVSLSRLLSIMLALFLFNTANAQKNAVAVSIIQNGKEIKIKGDTQTIVLKKDEFKILFNSFAYTDKKSYATQIDDFSDKKGVAMIYNGEKIDSIPYFMGGTGMATGFGKEYECMYFDKDFDANHYIIYQENGDKRAKLEGKNGDTLRLSWTINKFNVNEMEMAIKKIEIKELYIVVFNDFNLNGTVDEGEYCIIHVFFE
jgi:hypothetical protein